MKDLVVVGTETVAEVADLMSVSGTEVVRAGFEKLGRLFTLHQRLSFEEIRDLAAVFGYAARRR